MSNEWDDDGHDGDSNESPLVKDLRKQLRAAKKENGELTEKVTKLEGVSRERAVKDVLADKGVRPGIAKYIPSELTSEDEINKWLEENAEDFGIDLKPGGDAGQEPDPSTVERQRADQLAGRGVAPTKIADLEARLAKAESPAEVDAIMAEARQFVM